MRRLALTSLALFGLLATTPATSVRAQEPAPVRLTLLSQTPWNSTGGFGAEHGRELAIRFRAENLGATSVGDLSIGITLFGRVLTRTAYEDSLVADPPVALKAETRPRVGTLEPGGTRDFEVPFRLDETAGLDPDDSGIYPLKIDLRSGFTSLAAIRTPVVFLVRRPEEPMRLSWTFVLHHPIEFGPDDAFVSTGLETSLAPGGRLAAQMRALLELSTRPNAPAVDVAMSPTLLMQLERMRDGYAVREGEGQRRVAAGEGGALAAEQTLAALRAIARAPNVRVSAMPFSMPELPALAAGGLARDVDTQLDRGRDVVSQVLSSGGTEITPVAGVLRPPGAALDTPTLRELTSHGISTVLVEPSTVRTTPDPLGFAEPPTAALTESGSLRAVVPDAAVTALMRSPLVQADPVRAAHVVLGEIAAIWQERPSPGVPRGIAVVLSEDAPLPPAFYLAFTRALAGAPWLSAMHAGDFATLFAPRDASSLAATSIRRFPTTYVEQLKQARRRVATYRSMLSEPTQEPDRLETMLLLAQSRQFLSNPDGGLAFITRTRDAVGSAFGAIDVDHAPVITLTSSAGSGVPVTVRNGGEDALRFTVQLISDGLSGTPSVELELPPGDEQTVTFRVDLVRAGRFQAQLVVLAPTGRPILEPQTLTVRSTVYNRIALVITIAAALVLLALWARRFVPRRTS